MLRCSDESTQCSSNGVWCRIMPMNTNIGLIWRSLQIFGKQLDIQILYKNWHQKNLVNLLSSNFWSVYGLWKPYYTGLALASKRVAPSSSIQKAKWHIYFLKRLAQKRDCMQKKMHRKLWMSRETIHFSWQSHHSHYRTENDRLLKVAHCFCFYSKMWWISFPLFLVNLSGCAWCQVQAPRRFIWHQTE